jgi:hydroxyacylglutathione hydrolase
MNNLTEIVPNIYRLVIPFLDIYTTVFIIKTPDGAALFDTATYEGDMDKYVFPALIALGISPEMLRYVFISHNHRDHAGGLNRLIRKFSQTCIVTRSNTLKEKYRTCSIIIPEDGDMFSDCLRIVSMPGHSLDCMGIFDIRTKTLLSGDCLQLYGIYGSGKWGSNISFPDKYLAVIDKLTNMDIDTIIASHNYYPCNYIARGKTETSRYLRECVDSLYRMKDAINENCHLDDETIARQYTEEYRLPTVAKHVVTAIREALDTGKI